MVLSPYQVLKGKQSMCMECVNAASWVAGWIYPIIISFKHGWLMVKEVVRRYA
jgi:hypothetical protein